MSLTNWSDCMPPGGRFPFHAIGMRGENALKDSSNNYGGVQDTLTFLETNNLRAIGPFNW